MLQLAKRSDVGIWEGERVHVLSSSQGARVQPQDLDLRALETSMSYFIDLWISTY